jgi:CubicO group peptidase (beta-lactamase class C family)
MKSLKRPSLERTCLERTCLAAASAIALALSLAACAPEAAKPEAAAPAAPAVADPAVSSLEMAADPATLGFNPEAFAKAKADIEAGIKAGKIPGGLFLVAKGGKVVNITAVGTEGPGDTDPVTPETIFRVYSMSKPIVSVATMQLVEDGKIGLDDPISKYIPEFANPKVLVGKGQTRPAAREITVRDLLSHKSGLIYGIFAAPDDELGKMYMAAGDVSFDITALELSKAIAALPLAFDPGSKWTYSRSTDVLGAVIEKAAGKPLDVLLDEQIFTPLGMDDTHFYLEEDEFNRLAEPPAGIALSTPKEKAPMLSGGGGLNSTTEDYFRFVEMLRGKGTYRGVEIIKPETLATMLEDQIATGVDRKAWFYDMIPGTGFGLGFGLIPVNPADPASPKYFTWSGYAGTNMWIDPANDITTIFMMQNNEASADFRPLHGQWVYGGYKPASTSGPAATPAEAAPQ